MTPSVQQAPAFSPADAVRLARDLYGLAATARPLPSERDQNFHLQSPEGAFVLKIANPTDLLPLLDLQNQAFHHLASASTGLYWPSLVSTLDGRSITSAAGHHVRLLTWVPGRCLAEVSPYSPELLASLGRALAQTDAALASFAHPAAHRTLHWDLRHAYMAIPHLDLLSTRQRALAEPLLRLHQTLDWSALSHSIVHNDPNDYNILVDGSGSRVTALLDLGDMVHTATVCNLAIALAYVMLGQPDPIAAAARVVAGYHAVRPLSALEIDALYTLAVTRLCCSVCYAAAQSQAAPQNEYLNITNAPAWALLERLAAFPPDWPRDVFHRATQPRPDLPGARRRTVGPSLSLSYDEPLHITYGRGAYLFDSSGRAYLDCVNNVAHVGHCHPRVVRAAARQMEALNTNTRYLHELLTEYALRLTATLPEPLSVVYLVCSGSEANELALRLARTHTRRDEVLVIDTAYHGNTNALVDISPYKFNSTGGRGKPAHVHVAPMPCSYRGLYRGPDAAARYAESVVAAARRASNLGVFFAESALGCAGQVPLPSGYLEAAYEAVRANGGVCVADEVQTGFGRAGSHFWTFETQGVVPDIVTLGKPIGNGHPMGAVVTTPAIAASFHNGMEYFNTFGGNPVSCAAGLAVLDVIRDENLQEHARDTGAYLLEGLRGLSRRFPLIGDVRGLGLFLGFELVRDPGTREPAPAEASRLVNRMKDRGVLLSTDGPFHNVIKIKPPLVFNRADADLLLQALESELS